MTENASIVAVGAPDEVACFRNLGADVVPLTDPADLAGVLSAQARRPGVALIVVSEPSLRGDYRVVSEARRSAGAVVLVVPSYRGSEGLSLACMRGAVRQSIGVDLISDD